MKGMVKKLWYRRLRMRNWWRANNGVRPNSVLQLWLIEMHLCHFIVLCLGHWLPPRDPYSPGPYHPGTLIIPLPPRDPYSQRYWLGDPRLRCH